MTKSVNIYKVTRAIEIYFKATHSMVHGLAIDLLNGLQEDYLTKNSTKQIFLGEFEDFHEMARDGYFGFDEDEFITAFIENGNYRKEEGETYTDVLARVLEDAYTIIQNKVDEMVA